MKVSKSDKNSNNQKKKDDPDDPPEDPEDGDTPGSDLSAIISLPLHVLPGLTAKLVKAQRASPKICRKSLVDKVIKENQQLDLCIPVEGEPAPECVWKFNDAKVQSGGNVKVSYGTNVIRAKRSNVGKYSLSAKNKHGEDSVEVSVEIFSKPTIPVGPLEVSEVSRAITH